MPRVSAVGWLSLGTMVVLLGWLAICPTSARAQSCGSTSNATVYGTCSGSSALIGSAARVDASVYCGSSGCSGFDPCTAINDALSALPVAGGIVDARGVITTANCSSNPFSGISKPSTVLLPGISIPITTTWVLPNQTRIVGEARQQTTLSAQSPSFSGPMIQMGSNTVCPSNICTGISVSDLILEGNAQTTAIDGIYNANAQDLSYVDHVTIDDMGGAGLRVIGAVDSGNGDNSGPYSDLWIKSQQVTNNSVNGTSCVTIAAQTKGLHGITCIGGPVGGPSGTTPYAGIYIDGSNNSIEDVHIESFQDGNDRAATGSTAIT